MHYGSVALSLARPVCGEQHLAAYSPSPWAYLRAQEAVRWAPLGFIPARLAAYQCVAQGLVEVGRPLVPLPNRRHVRNASDAYCQHDSEEVCVACTKLRLAISQLYQAVLLSKSHQKFMSRAEVIARHPREPGSLIQSTLVPPASTPELFSSATKRMTEWRHRYRTWLLQQVQGSSRIFQVAATPNTIAVRPDDNVLARCA